MAGEPSDSLPAETAVLTTPPAPAAPADVAAPAPPVPPGYELLGEGGRGGMGVVYKVRNVKLNRVEAIKTTRAGEFADPHELARFRLEAEAAAGLDHPNIVTVYGVGEGRGGPYLAMRWVDGRGLDERRPTTPAAVAALLAKVARAVHYAHQHGILHRDLKPQNILVDAAGEPHVADFGIARRIGADATVTQAGVPIGTPAYMSPEQARGDTNLTVGSDVYALGVVLYELLTGTLPHTGSAVQILRKAQSDEAPVEPRRVNPGVDPDLEAVCLKCLEKEPARRYQTAAELADELERFLRDEAVLARPPGLWDWLRQLARTRPEPNPNYSWPVTAWFGAVVLLANVIVYWLTRSGGSALGVWAVNGGCAAFMVVVLWWYMLRRFGHLPPTERHSLIIAAGHVVIYVALTVAYVPVSAGAPASSALGMYPGLASVSGLGLFTLGSTNWSRFFPVSLGMIALAPVLAWWPGAAPLVYGAAVAVVMWYWTFAKKVKFGGPRGR